MLGPVRVQNAPHQADLINPKCGDIDLDWFESGETGRTKPAQCDMRQVSTPRRLGGQPGGQPTLQLGQFAGKVRLRRHQPAVSRRQHDQPMRLQLEGANPPGCSGERLSHAVNLSPVHRPDKVHREVDLIDGDRPMRRQIERRCCVRQRAHTRPRWIDGNEQTHTRLVPGHGTLFGPRAAMPAPLLAHTMPTGRAEKVPDIQRKVNPSLAPESRISRLALAGGLCTRMRLSRPIPERQATQHPPPGEGGQDAIAGWKAAVPAYTQTLTIRLGSLSLPVQMPTAVVTNFTSYSGCSSSHSLIC